MMGSTSVPYGQAILSLFDGVSQQGKAQFLADCQSAPGSFHIQGGIFYRRASIRLHEINMTLNQRKK
jgi:hypothetical protein